MDDNRYKIEYEFVPNIRTRFVADDGREFENLGTAWALWIKDQNVSTAAMIKNSGMNKRECKHFWCWLGRTDPAPLALKIFLAREDVQRIWPVSPENKK
jgi:hypothetical protein